VKVEATLWVNGDGYPQVTLYLPEGPTIMQVPSRAPGEGAKTSKAYRDVMRALEAQRQADLTARLAEAGWVYEGRIPEAEVERLKKELFPEGFPTDDDPEGDAM
jgi:hypothetical protein